MKRNTRDAYRFVFLLLLLSAVLIAVNCLFLSFSRLFAKNDVDVSCDESKLITIVLDAGHGGIDSGASNGDVFEKDLNLTIVRKIRDILQLYDLNIVLTRDDDNMLADRKSDDLLNRVKIANQFDDTIFVSVHMNKFPEGKYKGLQVFYSKNSPYSEALALKLQSNNRELLESDNNRAVKKATSEIYVLDRTLCPAVLIECGFLSNRSDLEKLCDENYQNKLAFVIAGSIIEYIGL